MATPIYEDIMADLETKIDLITVGNGFEHTLEAERARPGLGNRVRDGLVVIMMGETEEGLTPMQRTAWNHKFNLFVYAVQHEDDAISWQTKALQMAADITKKLMEDHTRNSKAVDTFVGPPSMVVDHESNTTAMNLPVLIHYRYDVKDPYSQT